MENQEREFFEAVERLKQERDMLKRKLEAALQALAKYKSVVPLVAVMLLGGCFEDTVQCGVVHGSPTAPVDIDCGDLSNTPGTTVGIEEDPRDALPGR